MKQLTAIIIGLFTVGVTMGAGRSNEARAQVDDSAPYWALNSSSMGQDAPPMVQTAAQLVTPNDAQPPQIEVVFALDTTGSMSGLIATAQSKIWSIASSMSQADPVPEIKVGLIAYRDRGDIYVTRRTALTMDLDAVYEQLMDYQADGGGDTPEAVNQALHEAVTTFNWSTDPNTYRVIFLVGDSPPKQYNDDVSWKQSARLAGKKDIIVNTIQMGSNPQTTLIWKNMSKLAMGQYIQVDGNASGLEIATPYDVELAELADELDDSRLYYGTNAERKQQAVKKDKARHLASKMSVSAKARRGSFNAGGGKKAGYWGKKELVESFGNNAQAVSTVDNAQLPTPMQTMSDQEKVAYVKQQKARRAGLKKKIRALEKKRQTYIQQELAKRDDKGKNSFSEKVYRAVRKQAAGKAMNLSESVRH